MLLRVVCGASSVMPDGTEWRSGIQCGVRGLCLGLWVPHRAVLVRDDGVGRNQRILGATPYWLLQLFVDSAGVPFHIHL